MNLQIEGMALAALSGIILNLILPKEKKNQTLNKRGSFRRQVMKNLFSMEYLTNDDIFNLIQTASRFKSGKKLSLSMKENMYLTYSLKIQHVQNAVLK